MNRVMPKRKKVPIVDYSCCNDCGSCIEICPSIFVKNPETGFVEVVELDAYPESDIEAAIALCPRDCITWEKIKTP